MESEYQALKKVSGDFCPFLTSFLKNAYLRFLKERKNPKSTKKPQTALEYRKHICV